MHLAAAVVNYSRPGGGGRGDMTAQHAGSRNNEAATGARTALLGWFAVVCLAYYYKPVLCGGVGQGLGIRAVCESSFRGISTNHWIEIIVYSPVMWFGLHRAKAGVFARARNHRPASSVRRRELAADFGVALMLYGFGLHVANVIEIYSRSHGATGAGAVYDLTYFIDEGLSHYVILLSLFFVLGWLIINDPPDRTVCPTLATLIGVAHGVERGVAFIEAGKWFLFVPVLAWFAVAITARWQEHDRNARRAGQDFFFRYAVSFALTMPITVGWYRLSFGSFEQPSRLPNVAHAPLAVGMVLITAAGATIAIAAPWIGGKARRPRRPGVPVGVAQSTQFIAESAPSR